MNLNSEQGEQGEQGEQKRKQRKVGSQAASTMKWLHGCRTNHGTIGLSDHLQTSGKLFGKHQQQQNSYLSITISVKNSDLDMKRQTRKMYANVNFLLRKFQYVLLV